MYKGTVVKKSQLTSQDLGVKLRLAEVPPSQSLNQVPRCPKHSFGNLDPLNSSGQAIGGGCALHAHVRHCMFKTKRPNDLLVQPL